MGEKILVGPITKGLRNDVTPFNIDNDSFPTLVNAYQWRGRVKRKRGTDPLVQLYRTINKSPPRTTGSGNFNGNILTGLEANSSVVFNSISVGTDLFTDPASNGVLTGSSGGSGTINYATGALTLTGAPVSTNIQFNYYPTLPVMGLEDLVLDPTAPIGLIAFDTTYSYNVSTNDPFPVNDVSYYDVPSGSPASFYPGYVAKTVWTPTTWNGGDYQQFGTVNYQGAFWATNGINIPFSIASIGMQFKFITNVVITSAGPPAIADLTIAASGLVIGDFLFINEVFVDTISGIKGINFQTGYVTNVVGNVVTVEFPLATLTGAYSSGGIAQYLTNRSSTTKDCLRYYLGSPTNSTTPITFNQDAGWVNFMPPLSSAFFSIADLPPAQYYLVGAIIILPFKDRLLFIGPVVQASGGNPIYLQDTVIYSQNGTPFYTASFSVVTNAANPTGLPTPTSTYQPYLVPINQTADPRAYWEDQTGLGGFITAGFQSAINTASPNEDVIIMGFTERQARFAYTGNDILPFQFFVINSELGSGSTYSAINLDRGVLTMGSRGFIITSQIEAQRIDLLIPSNIFQIDLLNQGAQRICAARDFMNEWVYFTYNTNNTSQNDTPPVYPTQTLQYNYREQTWGLFNESYTTYGTFRPNSGLTWATVGKKFRRWRYWSEPWNSYMTTASQPIVIAGNTQGFVIQRGIDTDEAPSLDIKSINFTTSVITSPNHCLNTDDYIVIRGVLGTGGAVLNERVFQIDSVTNNTFQLDPPIPAGSYTYLGLGTITRTYIPFIASKAFPVSWQYSRKTRLGNQMYLMTNSTSGQVTLYIYLSQNYAEFPGDNAYNFGDIVPTPNSDNDGLIYSAVLFTSPEYPIQSTYNLSLGPIGNGVLTSFTFNYFELFDFSISIVPGSLTISVGSVATFVDDGVGGFTVTGTGSGGSVLYNTGMVNITFSAAPTAQTTKTSFQYYYNNLQSPTAGAQKQIWHRINTSLIGDVVQFAITMNDSQMRDPNLENQFAEVELHAAVLDISASSLLA